MCLKIPMRLHLLHFSCANINYSFIKKNQSDQNLFNKIISWKSTYYQNGKQFKIWPLTSSTYVKADLLE